MARSTKREREDAFRAILCHSTTTLLSASIALQCHLLFSSLLKFSTRYVFFLMIFQIKNGYHNRIILLVTAMHSLVNAANDACRLFEKTTKASRNYCHVLDTQETAHRVYERCLLCYVSHEDMHLSPGYADEQCFRRLHCVEFEFYNETLFERFFGEQPNLLSRLFETPDDPAISNTLYIKIRHDRFQRLDLDYLQRILLFDSEVFSNLHFILPTRRNSILLDLERGFAELPLVGLRVQITCENGNRVQHDKTKNGPLSNHTQDCVTRQSTVVPTTQAFSRESSTRNDSSTAWRREKFLTRASLFLVAGVILVLCVCLLFTSIYAYLRWQRRKKDPMTNQRLSLASSAYSAESFDTGRDDRPPSDEKNSKDEKISQFTSYQFDDTF